MAFQDVNIMEQEKFEQNIQRVSAWMDENDAGAMGVVVQEMLHLPHESDSDRDRIWAGIRSIVGMLPNSPIKRGRGSSLSPEQEAVLSGIQNDITAGLLNLFNSPLMSVLLRKHGKSGGDLWANAEEYAEHESARIVGDLKKRLKDGIWDGTREGLNTQTFPEAEVSEEE